MNPLLAFIYWLIMVSIAVANGFLAPLLVGRSLGDYAAHLYKTFLIIAVIFVFSRIFLVRAGAEGGYYTLAIATGLQWLVSSVIFEFLFGHYVFGFSWERLLADYRIHEGRLWSLVLASEVIAPLFNAWLLSR